MTADRITYSVSTQMIKAALDRLPTYITKYETLTNYLLVYNELLTKRERPEKVYRRHDGHLYSIVFEKLMFVA